MAGELAGGHGAAHVEGLGAAGEAELFGTGGDGGVQVQGIGQVELGLHEGGAGEGDLVVVEGDVPTLGGPLGFLQRCSGMNRAVASATSRSSWARLILWAKGATWVSTNAAASWLRPRVASAMRRAFHGASPPGSPARVDPALGAREAVLQLHRVRDQDPPGVGGAAGRGGELGDAELRDQRGALTGQGQGVVGAGPGRLQPGDSGGFTSAQLTAACSTSASARSAAARALPGEREHRGTGVEVGTGGGHVPDSSSGH